MVCYLNLLNKDVISALTLLNPTAKPRLFQVGLQNELIREWFETTETSSGVLCAVQHVSSLHILTQRLINGWLLKYKRTNTT